MKILLKLSGLLVLIGCADSTAFVEQTDPCKAPVQIPERYLTDQEVEIFWAKDRKELRDCGDKVETLSGRSITK